MCAPIREANGPGGDVQLLKCANPATGSLDSLLGGYECTGEKMIYRPNVLTTWPSQIGCGCGQDDRLSRLLSAGSQR